MAPRLILASNSIRRYDLLGQVGIIPDIIDPSNVDETIYDPSLPPHQIALMLARKKAYSISENEQYKNDFILAADTVVAIGRKIIEKTEDIEKEYKRLIAQGVKFIRKPEIEKWGGKVATFEDPDKNRINLIEQKK